MARFVPKPVIAGGSPCFNICRSPNPTVSSASACKARSPRSNLATASLNQLHWRRMARLPAACRSCAQSSMSAAASTGCTPKARHTARTATWRLLVRALRVNLLCMPCSTVNVAVLAAVTAEAQLTPSVGYSLAFQYIHTLHSHA